MNTDKKPCEEQKVTHTIDMTEMLKYMEYNASAASRTSDVMQEEYYISNISLECCAYRYT
jgi:hypothetical protein